jgi:hypothetical protein
LASFADFSFLEGLFASAGQPTVVQREFLLDLAGVDLSHQLANELALSCQRASRAHLLRRFDRFLQAFGQGKCTQLVTSQANQALPQGLRGVRGAFTRTLTGLFFPFIRELCGFCVGQRVSAEA